MIPFYIISHHIGTIPLQMVGSNHTDLQCLARLVQGLANRSDAFTRKRTYSTDNQYIKFKASNHDAHERVAILLNRFFQAQYSQIPGSKKREKVPASEKAKSKNRRQKTEMPQEANNALTSSLHEVDHETLAFIRKTHPQAKNGDPYSFFGLEKGASKDEVGRAYRKTALKMHPDKNEGSPVSEKAYKALEKARTAIIGS
ncbi:MAG: J domain-containing protein [Chlamydiia bacterium]|nr:J domain-containing protein [Chlamydiia bacterium]